MLAELYELVAEEVTRWECRNCGYEEYTEKPPHGPDSDELRLCPICRPGDEDHEWSEDHPSGPEPVVKEEVKIAMEV